MNVFKNDIKRDINFSELELGEKLGVGGYGEVCKAVWKGTDVAVKQMLSEDVNKEMQQNFVEEVSCVYCVCRVECSVCVCVFFLPLFDRERGLFSESHK